MKDLQANRQRIRKLRFVTAIAVLLFLMVWAEPLSACPTCKEGIAGEHGGVSLGYYWSILFMIATPFSIFAVWAFCIWRMIRSNEYQHQVLEPEA